MAANGLQVSINALEKIAQNVWAGQAAIERWWGNPKVHSDAGYLMNFDPFGDGFAIDSQNWPTREDIDDAMKTYLTQRRLLFDVYARLSAEAKTAVKNPKDFQLTKLPWTNQGR